MANKKKSIAKKATKSTRRRSSNQNPATKATAQPPAISSEQIGQTAGTVWQALHQQGEMTLAALKKSVDAPGDVVPAAVGWLAREGKLDFTSSGRSVKVSLR